MKLKVRTSTKALLYINKDTEKHTPVTVSESGQGLFVGRYMAVWAGRLPGHSAGL